MKITRRLACLVIALAVPLLPVLPADAAIGTGSIAGTVTGSSGEPLADICVTAYDVLDFYFPTGGAVTDADGDYLITDLPESAYSVAFVDCDHLYGVEPEAYDDWDVIYYANLISVPDGEAITGIDAVLQRAGTIKGTVTRMDGSPIEGGCVTAATTTPKDEEQTAVTDAAGRYELTGVRSGTVRVRVDACGTDDFPTTARPSLVTLAEGATVNGADVVVGAPDTTAPNTVFTETPMPDGTVISDPNWVPSGSYVFDTSVELDAERYECRRQDQLGDTGWYSCFSPSELFTGSAGANTFSVRAYDYSGNVDLTPASHTFTYSPQLPPQTTITSGPDGSTISVDSATFGFTASPAGGSFECRLDAGSWAGCSSPHTINGIGNGSHTFRVRAVDVYGQRDSSPATRSFQVSVPSAACLDAQDALEAAELAVTEARATLVTARTTLRKATRAVKRARAAVRNATTALQKERAQRRLRVALRRKRAAVSSVERALSALNAAVETRDEAQDSVNAFC